VIRTTLLNPTVWLLAATIVAGVIAQFRGFRLQPEQESPAHQVIEQVIRLATTLPVLLLLLSMALAGAGSRIVLGYLSPGAYAEEVVAAHRFNEGFGLYGGDSGGAWRAWQGPVADAAVPWSTLPGITPCQSNAMANREQFFTEHAHPPTLLLAGVPIVQVAGAKGLYVLVVLLSLAAVGAMVFTALARGGIDWRSRRGLLVIIAIAGWQPVVAGIRQGDAVLAAAGLTALAWYLARRGRGGALAGAVAACLALPAIGVIPAMLRQAPRAGVAAVLLVFAALVLTFTVAGPAVAPAFAMTVADTTRTYADAVANYSMAGRALESGAAGAVLLAAVVGIVLWTGWRARTVDAAFAGFVAAGLLVAPVLWSQHLALAFVPGIVLLGQVYRSGSALALAGWACLMLALSLPDTAVIGISRGASAVLGQHVSPVPYATVALWAWSTARA